MPNLNDSADQIFRHVLDARHAIDRVEVNIRTCASKPLPRDELPGLDLTRIDPAAGVATAELGAVVCGHRLRGVQLASEAPLQRLQLSHLSLVYMVLTTNPMSPEDSLQTERQAGIVDTPAFIAMCTVDPALLCIAPGSA